MGGSSRIVINDQGITISTDGKILYQAGQHRFEKGEKVENDATHAFQDYSHQVQLTDQQGHALGANIPYYIYDQATQKEFYGRTGEHGKTARISAQNENTLDIKIGREAIEYMLAKGIKP
jgi:type VI secretion system secreted protein VgrG